MIALLIQTRPTPQNRGRQPTIAQRERPGEERTVRPMWNKDRSCGCGALRAGSTVRPARAGINCRPGRLQDRMAGFRLCSLAIVDPACAATSGADAVEMPAACATGGTLN